MNWEECLKIRWKHTETDRWVLMVDGKEVAIVQRRDNHFTWAAGGRFDWNPSRIGAMRNARWEYWVNRAPRYSAETIMANNSK